MEKPIQELPDATQINDYVMYNWLKEHNIVNEKGDPIDFENHLFLLKIYEDPSPKIVGMKAAQIGFSTYAILRNIHDAEKHKMDIIYTLPTDSDVGIFVGGKVNRIIANNPHLLTLTKDKDSIEQKAIGRSMLYFRGTWTKKAAIMITADRLVHDEKDSSKQDVIRDYQARLQHSQYKQVYIFSHPSVPNNGVDIEWQLSDQKEWFITCPHCKHFQYLSWNTEEPKKMSVDLVKREFICKKCKGILESHHRAAGQWVKRFNDREWSGYHISLLMAPWVTAAEIIDKYNDPKQTIDYFYNKVLGLPYAGGGNSVTKEQILGNITKDKNLYKGRLIIGVDTGIALRYVLGNKQGLVGFGEMRDYMPDEANKLPLHETLEYFLKSFENSIMVIDQGGDITAPRKLRAKYPGRVFLCHYGTDRKTMQLIRWGEKEESGNVMVDRNRAIQWVINEFKERRIKLFNGTESDWYDYWIHWSHIYRISEEDQLKVMRYKWERSDRDDWVHATVYWRAGIERFGAQGAIVMPGADLAPDSYMVEPNQTTKFDPHKMFGGQHSAEEPWWAIPTEDEEDWRNS